MRPHAPAAAYPQADAPTAWGLADARIGTSGTSGDGAWPSEWLEGGSPEYLAVMEPPYNTQRPDLGRPLLDDHGELFYLAGPKL